MLVLGIETTCDETGIALVKDGKKILVNLVRSQSVHEAYAGVFPEYASRRHCEVILPLIDKALEMAEISPESIDLIAAAYGPGLISSIVMGLSAAKSLSLAWEKPFIGINHVEAHLYAAMMSSNDWPSLPAIGIVVSGGHTALLHIDEDGKYALISSTVDDALGEAFDKAASMMHLPYPGGPHIEKLAQMGNPEKYPFRAGQVKKNPLDFSFSGLKTSLLYTLKGKGSDKKTPNRLPKEEYPHLAASFQAAAFSDLLKKTLAAAEKFPCKSLLFGGGVSINSYLRELFENEFAGKIPIYWPVKELCLDNGAMVAGLGFHKYRAQGHGDCFELEARPRIPFKEWTSIQK